jgi:tetratricopeptide (TPR) repeat protein
VPPLAADDAVELFVARSRAAGTALELSDELVPVISDICERLDGLPLAIELAAARTRAFPLAEIASRLNDRFRLLTGGSRTALPRQQTLRAVVDWSYELLFDDEQRLFERLSVFPGGCDLATAEAVCADDVLVAADVADTVQTLVDKSLVIAQPVGEGVRFVQLQTLAQYGREKLTERGEAGEMRDAMAAHFAHLCSQSAAAFTGEGQRAWLIAMDAERDNLRAALEWAVARDDAETALTIAGGASWPHWLSGTVIEGKRWLDDAFGCAGEPSDGALALALTGRGLIDFLAGASTHTDADLEAAMAIFRTRDDLPSMSLAHSFYAEQAAVRGDTEEARRRRLDVLALYDGRPQDAFVSAARSYSLGKLAVLDGDLAEAEVQYRAAAEGFADTDRPIMLSISLGIAAEFDERAGDHAAAIEKLEAAIATNDALGLKGLTGALVARLGWMLLHVGDVDRAEVMYDRALDMARWLRSAPVVFLSLVGSAAVHRLRGRDAAAAAAAAEALEHHVVVTPQQFRNRIDPETEVWAGAAACCAVLGAVAAERGDHVEAAQLLGKAEQLWSDAGAPVPPFQRDDIETARATAEAALGGDALLAAWERGAAAPMEDLLASRART